MALSAWIYDKGSPTAGNWTLSFIILCVIVQDSFAWRHNNPSRVSYFPVSPSFSWISSRFSFRASFTHIPTWLFILVTNKIWCPCCFEILISFSFCNFQIFYFFRSQKNRGLRLTCVWLDKGCFSCAKRYATLVLCGFSNKKLAWLNRVCHVDFSLWFTLRKWFII